MKRHIIYVLVLLAIAASILSGCTRESPSTVMDTIESHKSEKIADSQLHRLVIPKSIIDLSGETADAWISEYNDDTATATGPSGEEIPFKQVYSDAYKNDDGTITLVFTAEQLKLYRQIMRRSASLRDFIQSDYNAENGRPFKSTEFTDNGLTGIIVYVDKKAYGSDIRPFEAEAMGLYQIANGVKPDEWKAHVVVKDYKTGEIISEDDYPTEP